MPECAYCLGTGEMEKDEIRIDPETNEPVRGPVSITCPHCEGEGSVDYREHRHQLQDLQPDDFMEEKYENEDFARDGDNHN